MVVLAAGIVIFAGCGGGSSESNSDSTTADTATAETTAPETTAPEVSTTAAPTTASTFEVLDDRGWKLLNKNPDAQSGNGVIIFGKIIQFDARTGPTTFKAIVYRDQASRDNDYSLNNYTIADLSGDEAMLAEWLDDDKFSCECTIVRSEEYTTQNNETRLSILMNAKSLTRG